MPISSLCSLTFTWLLPGKAPGDIVDLVGACVSLKTIVKINNIKEKRKTLRISRGFAYGSISAAQIGERDVHLA